MPSFKTKLDHKIQSGLDKKHSSSLIARRLFFFDKSLALDSFQDELFTIFNEVSSKFEIPFTSVSLAGSSQVGYSYFKKRDFKAGESDLDLAIIDSGLFRSHSELVFHLTKGYSNLTKFSVDADTGESDVSSFLIYLSKGYFRPDLMPNCPEKNDWFDFFSSISNRYSEIFRNINCGIYFSPTFFEWKQAPIVKEYKKGKK